MAKSFIEELTGYRVKVQKDGKEVLNVPGILAFPLLLAAPKAGILGMAVAPLLGCSIHLENETGRDVDIGKAVKNAADTFVNTAENAAKSVKETIEKAWDELSADDPEGCPFGMENEDEPAGEKPEEDIPTIEVKPDDTDRG